jgi:uncharacterized membrane protein (TIGR02234 family)
MTEPVPAPRTAARPAGGPAAPDGGPAGAGPAGAGSAGAGPVEAGSARREMGTLLAIGVAGAAGALLAGSQVWVRLSAVRPPPLPDVTVALAGREVEPLVPALGVVGLAGLVALLATRGRVRLLVGALLAASGLTVAVRAAGWVTGPDAGTALLLLTDAGRVSGVPPGTAVAASADPVWPALAVLGGLALLAAGVTAVLRARRWPGMSARYEAPAAAVARPATEPSAVWDALDRGDDPTAG